MNKHHPTYVLKNDWLKIHLLKGMQFVWQKRGYVGILAFNPADKNADWIGLPERLMKDNPETFERVDDGTIYIACPKCGAEQEDLDGFGVLYCEDCGYCTHSSITRNVCDLCHRKIKFETD